MANPAEKASPRIFIIDDEQFVRKYIVEIIESLDYEFAGSVDDANGALAAVDSMDCDLVLMDVCMPGMNGDKLLPLMKEKRPDLAIAMLTTRNSLDLVKECKKNGAVGYILKTGGFENIASNIEKILKRLDVVE